MNNESIKQHRTVLGASQFVCVQVSEYTLMIEQYVPHENDAINFVIGMINSCIECKISDDEAEEKVVLEHISVLQARHSQTVPQYTQTINT